MPDENIQSYCKKCSTNIALPDGYLCQACRDAGNAYQQTLVLEDSDNGNINFGVVKACDGLFGYIPKDAKVVGMWQVFGQGELWVSLVDSPRMLADELILKIQTVNAKKKEKDKTPRPKKKEVGKVLEQPVQIHLSAIDELRNMFKK